MSLRKGGLILILVLLNLASSGVKARPRSSDESGNASLAQRVSKAHFEFSLSLYTQLTESRSNLVFSPLSVNLLLSMLFLGTSSSSSSSRQLRAAMRCADLSYVDVHSAFRGVVESLDNEYYTFMHAATALFVANETRVSPPYRRALAEFYDASVQPLHALDAWARLGAAGAAAPILRPQIRSESLVGVGVLALSADWLAPFDKRATFQQGLFFAHGVHRKEVSLMSGVFRLPLGYSASLQCRVLELPFAERRVSLFLLLPDDPDHGLQRLEANVTTNNVKMLFGTLKDEEVLVRLPRFRLSSNASVTAALKAMGVTDIFDEKEADLQLLAPAQNLHVSTMAHTAVFDVHEGSTKTSTTTATTSSLRRRVFEVDHPFMFLVWDYYSGMLLLMGRVVDPEQH